MASAVRKAVIPAAGFGTRMLPAAKAVPKELLPILDRPTIQYVIEEAATAGIDDVLLVTGREKRAIEDHFDRNAELESRLDAGKKRHLLASLDALMAQVKVHSVRQPHQHGLGDAVLQARRYVGDEHFICLLGDTIFSARGGGELPVAQLLATHRQLGGSIIGLEEVVPEKVDRYGIVGGDEVQPGVWRLNALVEKPSRDTAPSRLAIAARYVLTPTIFSCLDQTPRGKGNEIQLTDALRLLLDREPIHGVLLTARRHDIGNPVDWLLTNLHFARRDEALWKKIEATVRDM